MRFLDKWGFALLLFAGIPLIAFAEALLLSWQNNLFHMASLTTLTPCGIITIAFLICSSSSIPRVFGGLLVWIYLLSSLQILGWDKANTSALADTLALHSGTIGRRGDHALLASIVIQLLFHFKEPANCLSLQFSGGADLVRSDQGPATGSRPMSRLRAEIDQAYHEGRRIWLVKSE